MMRQRKSAPGRFRYGAVARDGVSTAPDVQPKEMALYSRLHSLTAAALIAFAGVIAVGVPALLPAALERPFVVGGPPWMPQSRGSRPIDVPFAAESTSEQPRVEPQQTAAPEQPLVETQQTATRSEELTSPASFAWPELLRREATVPEQAILMPPLVAAEPLAKEPPAAMPATEAEPSAAQQPDAKPVIAREAETPAVKPARAAQRRLPAAKPAAEPQGRLAASKPPARPVRTAKKSTNEALNAVRKFGDQLRDIPVSSYSADGTRRDIVIRPTSIQDVYYYSAPR
jgi:hypothetical protein